VKPEENKQVCLTGLDGRMESGMPILAVVAIDPGNDPNAKKVLRLTMPLGLNLQYGTRFIIDQNPPLTAPFVACFQNGCLSDYELTADTLAKLKKGGGAVAQAINAGGGALTVPVPLAEFAKAFDGPPTDPKVLEERQKKLEEELKRKGEELQKKLEQSKQQPAAGQPAAKPQ
jgi:invasion protein IalB